MVIVTLFVTLRVTLFLTLRVTLFVTLRVMMYTQVTNLVELARVKCHQYYPESGSLSFGPVTITLLESIPLADFTIRSLKLEMVGIAILVVLLLLVVLQYW
jgi:hypothetical protein